MTETHEEVCAQYALDCAANELFNRSAFLAYSLESADLWIRCIG